jgi:hypothetical protein
MVRVAMELFQDCRSQTDFSLSECQSPAIPTTITTASDKAYEPEHQDNRATIQSKWTANPNAPKMIANIKIARISPLQKPPS